MEIETHFGLLAVATGSAREHQEQVSESAQQAAATATASHLLEHPCRPSSAAQGMTSPAEHFFAQAGQQQEQKDCPLKNSAYEQSALTSPPCRTHVDLPQMEENMEGNTSTANVV